VTTEGGVGDFATKLFAMAMSVEVLENKVRLIICNLVPIIWCKDLKIGLADPEIIQLQAKKSAAIFDSLLVKLVTIAMSLEQSETDIRLIICIHFSISAVNFVKIGPKSCEIIGLFCAWWVFHL